MKRIYLALQTISDGRIQVRRYSPDSEKTTPVFEPRSDKAKEWLIRAGKPKWTGNHLEYPKHIEPYDFD
jgi:hypothetical protein